MTGYYVCLQFDAVHFHFMWTEGTLTELGGRPLAGIFSVYFPHMSIEVLIA